MASERGAIGLISLLLLLGVILFLFPEPVTSGLGMTILVLAVIIWVFSEVL